jgi:hypothetical protein
MKGGANPLNFIEFKRKIISENPVYRQTDEWWEYLEQDLSYYAFDEEQRRIQENTRGIVNDVTLQGTNLMVPPEGFDNLDLLFILGALISKSYIERKMETMQQVSLLNVKSVNRFSIGLNTTPRQFVEFVESLIESLKGLKEFGFWMDASRNTELKEIVNMWYSGNLNDMSKNLQRMFYLWPQSLLVAVLNLEEFVDVAYTDVFPDSRQTTLAKRLRANPSVLEPLDEQLVTVNDDILNQEYAKLLSDIDDELEIYNSDKSTIHGQKQYLEEIKKDIDGHNMNYEKILDKYKTYRARRNDDKDVPGFLYNLTKDYYKFINNILDKILYDTVYHHLELNYNMDKSIQRGYYMMLTLLLEFRTLLTDVDWHRRARVVLKNVLVAIETRIRWIQNFLQPAPGNIPRTAMPLLGENLREYEIIDSQLRRQDSRSTINKLKRDISFFKKDIDFLQEKLDKENLKQIPDQSVLDSTIKEIEQTKSKINIGENMLTKFMKHFEMGYPTRALDKEYEMYKQNDFDNLTPEQLEELQKLDEEERYMYETQSTAVPGKPSQTVERRLYDRFNKQNEGQQLNVDRTYNPQVAKKMRELERQRREPSKTARQLRWLEREGVNIKTPFDNQMRLNKYLTLKNKPVDPRLSAINRQIQSRQQPRDVDSRRLARRIDDERRYRSNPDYFGELINMRGDEGYQMQRMFDDGLGYDVVQEEPTNGSEGSVASTMSDMGQPVNRQLNFGGGKKKHKRKTRKRKPKKKTKKKTN